MQPAARADPSVLAVYHTGVTVSSLDRSLQFYRDLLGLELEVVGTRTARQPYIQRLVDAPGATLEIALLRAPGSPHLRELLEYVDVERAPRMRSHEIPVQATCVSSFATSRGCVHGSRRLG
jgi:catechol 2,3-dioxygenase-like lactoylglutathione lyase family enzyme